MVTTKPNGPKGDHTMTNTAPQPDNSRHARERITRYWHRARTPLLTPTTTGIWLASGALQELGTRITEWLW